MMEELSPAQREFVRSYNARRRAARLTVGALALAAAAGGTPLVPKAYEYPFWDLFCVLFLLSAYFNWVRAKCPSCGRYIGFSASRWWRDLPRGLRCDLEVECLDELD